MPELELKTPVVRAHDRVHARLSHDHRPAPRVVRGFMASGAPPVPRPAPAGGGQPA